MKASAIAVLLFSSLATAEIARVVCQQPPREWGNGNCNGDDSWACDQRCGQVGFQDQIDKFKERLTNAIWCIDEND
ncbi:hypothetical protein CMEL01_11737 [Colletotrichum melonis]|uniref:Uncharacterized protein n=2 Tax=Colletotrichum acutatum species complex TaxID=2707335 RepID=A0AAI9Y015_9PEZI|nr:hypothetical protein CLIM01_06282 [Colletotrichum limetticola]KAK1465745.1 hypothetical protein CMEL01_11737 [Colletotrichum melonis]